MNENKYNVSKIFTKIQSKIKELEKEQQDKIHLLKKKM